jgi:toxin ParE1/3/4
MKAFSVQLLSSAKQDLLSLHGYVAANDSQEKADELLDEIQARCSKLKTMPHRGRVVPELERIGIAHEFKELSFRPYRIIYTITKSQVFVHCVLDGRRDLQDLLQERLLR